MTPPMSHNICSSLPILVLRHPYTTIINIYIYIYIHIMKTVDLPGRENIYIKIIILETSTDRPIDGLTGDLDRYN